MEKHFEIASEVFLGVVVSGKVERVEITDTVHSDTAHVVLKNLHNFKGHLAQTVEIKSHAEPPDPGFTLGSTYLIALYGSDRVDFCGIVFEVAFGELPYEGFVNRATRVAEEPDNDGFRLAARVVNYFGKDQQ